MTDDGHVSRVEYIRHLRRLHFTLVVSCLTLGIFATLRPDDGVLSSAKKDLQIIREIITETDDGRKPSPRLFLENLLNTEVLTEIRSGKLQVIAKRTSSKPLLVPCLEGPLPNGLQWYELRDGTSILVDHWGARTEMPQTLEEWGEFWEASAKHHVWMTRGLGMLNPQATISDGESTWNMDVYHEGAGSPVKHLPECSHVGAYYKCIANYEPDGTLRLKWFDLGGGSRYPVPPSSVMVSFKPRIDQGTIQSAIAEKAKRDTGVIWATKKTAPQTFPELYEFLSDFRSVPLEEAEKYLDLVSVDQDKIATTIKIANLEIPIHSLTILGILLIAILQLYFFLHLRQLHVFPLNSREVPFFPWIGLHEGLLDRIVYFTSVGALPPVTVILLTTLAFKKSGLVLYLLVLTPAALLSFVMATYTLRVQWGHEAKISSRGLARLAGVAVHSFRRHLVFRSQRILTRSSIVALGLATMFLFAVLITSLSLPTRRVTSVSTQQAQEANLAFRYDKHRALELSYQSCKKHPTALCETVLREALLHTPEMPMRFTPTKPVDLLKFSVDGSILVTGAREGNLVEFWNTSTGSLISSRTIHGGRLEFLDLSRDGDFLLVGSQTDGQKDSRLTTIRVFSEDSPEPLLVRTGSFKTAVFLVDNHLAIAGEDRVETVPISLLLAFGEDKQDTRELWCEPPGIYQVEISRHPRKFLAINSLRGLMAFSEGDNVTICTIGGGGRVAFFKTKFPRISSVGLFSDDGQWLILGSASGIQVWPASGRQPLPEPIELQGEVIAISRDEGLLAMKLKDGSTSIVDLATESTIKHLGDEKFFTFFKEEDSTLWLTAKSDILSVWHRYSERPIRVEPHPFRVKKVTSHPGTGRTAMVGEESVHFLSSKRSRADLVPLPPFDYIKIARSLNFALTVTGESNPTIWDLSSGERQDVFNEHRVLFPIRKTETYRSPFDGRYYQREVLYEFPRYWEAFLSSSGPWVMIDSVDEGRLVVQSVAARTTSYSVDGVTGILLGDIDKTGRRIAVLGRDGILQAWHGRAPVARRDMELRIRPLDLIHRGEFLILAEGFDGHKGPARLSVLASDTLESLREWGESDSPQAFGFSEDSPVIAVGFSNGAVEVVGLESGGTVFRDKVHEGLVTAISVDPEGDLVASVGNDGILLVHEIESGRVVGRRHVGPVTALAFNKESKLLLSVGPSHSNIFFVEELLEKCRLPGFESRRASFSTDGKYVLILGKKDIVYRHVVSLEDLFADASSRLVAGAASSN